MTTLHDDVRALVEELEEERETHMAERCGWTFMDAFENVNDRLRALLAKHEAPRKRRRRKRSLPRNMLACLPEGARQRSDGGWETEDGDQLFHCSECNGWDTEPGCICYAR